jgi:hypothetical protein
MSKYMFKKNLSLTAFSFSLGCLAALHLGLLSIAAMLGYGQEIVNMLGALLIGYDASGAGLFLGLTWGFLIGGVYGFIFAWLYKKML